MTLCRLLLLMVGVVVMYTFFFPLFSANGKLLKTFILPVTCFSQWTVAILEHKTFFFLTLCCIGFVVRIGQEGRRRKEREKKIAEGGNEKVAKGKRGGWKKWLISSMV